MSNAPINIAYLVASVLFILGIKGLTHPRTAVRGNFLGALGMLIAIAVTLLDRQIVSYEVIIAGLVVGAAIGTVLALKIQMTAMPQLVAIFNGFGGGASALVAGAALFEAQGMGAPIPKDFTIAVAASAHIGTITIWGSLLAFGKLQEFLIPGNPVNLPGQVVLKSLIGIACIVLLVWLVITPGNPMIYWALILFSSIMGILLVMSIGGADMPVVIALLNANSGLAAAATGFVLSNNILIIAGSLVGASGIILTMIMCRAMNRPLLQVLFGKFGGGDGGPSADDVYEGKVKSTSADEVAMLFDAARHVVIVPGYGMAVSQAQHAVRDLAVLLEARGVDVDFAIHPVAGRMPGHMNVLLAEADVPYEHLKEMDEVNPVMEQVDVAIVIGANDVVNPVAITDPSSPIAGMPIIEVGKAQTVVVIKRSLSPGFAGIPNPLFAAENTLMFFSDGKKAFLDLISAVKEAG